MTELQTESDRRKQLAKEARDYLAEQLTEAKRLLVQAGDKIQEKKSCITALENHLQRANNQISELSQELRFTKDQLHPLQQEHASDKAELIQVKKQLRESYEINQEFPRPQYQVKASTSSPAASHS